MTIEELCTLLTSTTWFDRLGQPDILDGFVRIASLEAWATTRQEHLGLERLADQMEWLPSSKDQEDPIHRLSLVQRAETLGKKEEISRKALEIYKRALISLRRIDGNAALKIGAHDFTEAARGAALYATRSAAYEILLCDPGFWCRIMTVYQSEHWPCGLLPDRMVVYL